MSVFTVNQVDTELLAQAAVLRERAGSLRVQADGLVDPLATAYRRRASELEFEAWAFEVQSGAPYDRVHSAA